MLMRCTAIPKYRVNAHGNPYSFSLSPRKYQEDVNKCLSIGVAVSFFIFTSTVNCASDGDAVSRLLSLSLSLSRAMLLFAPHYSPQRKGERIIDNWAWRCMKMLQRVNRLFTTVDLLCREKEEEKVKEEEEETPEVVAIIICLLPVVKAFLIKSRAQRSTSVGRRSKKSEK